MSTVRISTRRDDFGLVAVLEIATADPIDERRDGGEDRCRGALVDRLELGARAGLASRPRKRLRIDMPLKSSRDASRHDGVDSDGVALPAAGGVNGEEDAGRLWLAVD